MRCHKYLYWESTPHPHPPPPTLHPPTHPSPTNPTTFIHQTPTPSTHQPHHQPSPTLLHPPPPPTPTHPLHPPPPPTPTHPLHPPPPHSPHPIPPHPTRSHPIPPHPLPPIAHRPLLGHFNHVFILDFTPGLNGLGKDTFNTRRETITFWDLMRFIIVFWRCNHFIWLPPPAITTGHTAKYFSFSIHRGSEN